MIEYSCPNTSPFSLVTPLPDSMHSPVHKGIVLDEYLAETGLVKILESWIKQLEKQSNLQYNPYPVLTSYAQRYAER